MRPSTIAARVRRLRVLDLYGLKSEKGVVTGVALGIIALVYVTAFVITRTAKSSPFLQELHRRRAAGLSGPDEELAREAAAGEA
jgi:hypothetical protein